MPSPYRPDALSGRHDDSLVDERGAADEAVPPAPLPLEQRAHVRPLPVGGRRPGGEGGYADAEHVPVVPTAFGTETGEAMFIFDSYVTQCNYN